MNQELMWWALFLAVSTLLVALPLLPAFSEWRKPTDVEPLSIVREHDGDVRRFALALRALVEPHLSVLAEVANREVNKEVPLAEGGTLILLGAPKALPLAEARLREAIVAVHRDLFLPSGECAASGIYGARNISTAAGAVLRAAVAEGDIRLGVEGEVLRWIHAGKSLTAGDSCRLHGRASANQQIELGEDVHFQRLNARVVRTGSGSAPGQHDHQKARPFDPAGKPLDLAGRFSVVEGDLDVPAGHAIEGSIVVVGRLSLAADARIHGSVKAGSRVDIGPRAVVTGAVVCAGDILAGSGTTIGGPLVAEGRIRLKEGSCIGSPEMQTTVSARAITLARNVSIHGSVWAKERGKTEGGTT